MPSAELAKRMASLESTGRMDLDDPLLRKVRPRSHANSHNVLGLFENKCASFATAESFYFNFLFTYPIVFTNYLSVLSPAGTVEGFFEAYDRVR